MHKADTVVHSLGVLNAMLETKSVCCDLIDIGARRALERINEMIDDPNPLVAIQACDRVLKLVGVGSEN